MYGVGITRRTLLKGAGSLAVAAAALPLLTACGSAANAPAGGSGAGSNAAPGSAGSPAGSGAPAARGSASASAPASSKIPSYIAVEGPKPDLPGRGDGVDAGYFKFPPTLFKSVSQAPGHGETVLAITNLIQGAVVPMEQNSAWQAVNKDLGLTLKQQLYGGSDYRPGLATVIAGGNLPDIIYDRMFIPNLSDFLQAQCANLSPFIAGDAVKDFPNLANIPSPSWAGTLFNGAIYAVPVPRPPFLNALLVRQDILDQAGLQAPKTADDFKKMLLALTKPQSKRWGIAAGNSSASAFGCASQSCMQMIFGAPNNWRVSGGKLVKDYETDEFKAAVSYTRDLFSAGVFHPDTPSLNGTTLSNALRNGEAAVAIHSFGALTAQWPILATQNPNAHLRVIHPFAADGGKAIYHQGPSNFGISYVKKASTDRVKLALQVLNYLAAPFGSQEATLLNYGVEGTHYNRDASGTPVLTDKGKAEVVSTWKYITSNPTVLFDPNRPQELATNIQLDEKAMADVAIPDPTLGLYSQTYATKSVILDQAMQDAINDIVQARRPVSDIDGLVATWRQNGGDKARGEYEAALSGK